MKLVQLINIDRQTKIARLEPDFIKARRCINGNDHARDIANLAEEYLAL